MSDAGVFPSFDLYSLTLWLCVLSKMHLLQQFGDAHEKSQKLDVEKDQGFILLGLLPIDSQGINEGWDTSVISQKHHRPLSSLFQRAERITRIALRSLIQLSYSLRFPVFILPVFPITSTKSYEQVGILQVIHHLFFLSKGYKQRHLDQ